LTLKEEHRLKVLETMMPKRIFGPKRDEVTGGWEKQHNEEYHNLYSSPSIITMIKSGRMRLVRHIACTERRGMDKASWCTIQKEKIITRKTKIN
jgi:hypothetical protein